MEEHRRLLSNDPQNSEEEWSDDLSDESFYSDSDSSVPEWESSINDTTGELLHIDCHPFVTQNNIETNKDQSPPFLKDQLRRSTRGKFLKLLRRPDSERQSRYPKSTELDSGTNKVKFRDSQEGEEKEVLLKVNNNARRFDAESTLGINISTLSDGSRVMIAGFPPNSEAKREKTIKIGDWLKSLNNIPVTYQNINAILEKLHDKNDLLLKLQRVAGVEVTKNPPINELNHQSQFVKEFVTFAPEREQALAEKLAQFCTGIVYLNIDQITETSADFTDIIYAYPGSFQKSFLCQSRGIFLTLNHLLHDVTKSPPSLTTIVVKRKLYHIVYTGEHNKLLLLMLPDEYVAVKAAGLLTTSVIKMFKFLYNTLDETFALGKSRIEIEHFFGRFFAKVLNGAWISGESFMVQSVGDISLQSAEFEQFLDGAPTLTLPNEAYVQVDDALTELEASDYRDWNEEPLDCQRLFTILGSALYHGGYLLASHFLYEDLKDIHVYLEHQGLFHISTNEPIKSLLLWREVFPSSCKSSVPFGKRYLLLCGSRKDLLAVIMEAGGCTEPAEDNMGPDAFYVEEVQATLAHIQELGIPELAERLLTVNSGIQINIPESCNKRKSDFIESLNGFKNGKEAKKPEVTSILKRRNSDQAVITQSVFSFAESEHSEDSASQSEISDERRFNEDSETEECGEGSQISGSSFDISELRQSILSEGEVTQPLQLTSGKENVLMHFVQFDAFEGLIVCPPECGVQSPNMDLILHNFRATALKIHLLFENTMRFKNMPAQDMAKSVMNKSLIAIKEHGVMFECVLQDEPDNRKNRFKYWVIGRLFYMPHPKELYVCYQDTIPQNIIELALKIDLSTMN